jgi:hypothetical protein
VMPMARAPRADRRLRAARTNELCCAAERRNQPENQLTNPRGGDFYLATRGDHNLAVDILCHAAARPTGPWTAVRTIEGPPVLSVRSSRFQPLSLRWPAMTDITTNKGGADAGSGSALIAFDSPDEQANLPDELTEIDDLPDELTEIDDDDSGGGAALGTGAVSGGFGFAGLALAVVSLTTNWTSGVVVSHGQYSDEVNAPSSGLTAQQQLNMYANAWHTQGWWAFAFAAVAVLFGAGALLLPRILRSGSTPGWVKATATSAIIVGLVGVLLAVLTIIGVFGGHLTAPASAN